MATFHLGWRLPGILMDLFKASRNRRRLKLKFNLMYSTKKSLQVFMIILHSVLSLNTSEWEWNRLENWTLSSVLGSPLSPELDQQSSSPFAVMGKKTKWNWTFPPLVAIAAMVAVVAASAATTMARAAAVASVAGAVDARDADASLSSFFLYFRVVKVVNKHFFLHLKTQKYYLSNFIFTLSKVEKINNKLKSNHREFPTSRVVILWFFEVNYYTLPP